MSQLLRTFEPTDALILHARDFPMQTVYSWERHGQFHTLYPGDPGEPPYDATEIFVRLYPFSSGMVREIFLKARSRTHHHVSHEDILFYQVSGRRIQIVNERSREVNAGDASIQISGVWKRVDQIIPGVFVEFSMERPAKADAEASWVAADEAPWQPVAEWSQHGTRTILQGAAAAAAPADAARYEIKTFPLQGYQLHEARLPRGTALFERTAPVDTLFYVVEGRMRARIGSMAADVEASDGMRAPAATAYELEALEDCRFLYAPIPQHRPA